MKQISLTRGLFALVNDSDFEWLNQWKWCAFVGRGGKYYAVRSTPRPNRKTIYMHVFIADTSGGKKTDHKNGDTLDNRRRNLRACENKQNLWNSGRRKDNTSGFKGVSWNSKAEAWEARIRVHPMRLHLGFFPMPDLAAKAYQIAARKYHGEFARV